MMDRKEAKEYVKCVLIELDAFDKKGELGSVNKCLGVIEAILVIFDGLKRGSPLPYKTEKKMVYEGGFWNTKEVEREVKIETYKNLMKRLALNFLTKE